MLTIRICSFAADRRRLMAASAVLVTALGCGHAALAQTAAANTAQPQPRDGQAAPPAALAEVVVTAQKREESLQRTPISIVALTSGDLQKKGVFNLTDLRSEAPALQVTPHPNSAATSRVFIRGVGNNDDQVTEDPSVAVYLDGVYVARSQGLAMDVAEIDRIEVLRGPQGSLYGRNATGGAINIITVPPTLGSFGFKEDLSFGDRDLVRSRTLVNIPLGQTFAAQFSYLRASDDGFVRNRGGGAGRFGDQDRQAYMASLLWVPIAGLKVRYTYDRSIIDDTPAFIAAVRFYPAEAPLPSEGSPYVRDLAPNHVVAQGHNLTVSWEASPSLTLKSITGYRRLANQIDEDYLSGVLGPFALFRTATNAHQDQFSQEFQAIGQAFGSRLKYVGGLYYFTEGANSFDLTAVPARGVQSNRYVTINNKAYAAYAQGTYTPPALGDRLHVTVGARWSEDVREATLRTDTLLSSGRVIPGLPGAGHRDFRDFSPTLIVAYDAAPGVNIYGKIVRGYKTGGFNIRASSIARFDQGFGPESLVSYEAGVKSQWFENRLRLNVDGFTSNYKDIQVNVQSDPTNISVTDVLNAGKARISGVEAELVARPIPALTASVNYAYLYARYNEIIDAAGVNVANDFRFVEAPPHSVTASLDYQIARTSYGVLDAYVDYGWQARKFTSSDDPRYIVKAYGLLNARLSLADIPARWGRIRVSLWGRNLTNETYYVSHFNAGLPAAIFGEPRTWGVDIGFQY